MPPAKPRPSDLAVEAKKTYIPYIQQMLPDFPANSYVYVDSAAIRVTNGSPRDEKRLRVAIIDGDPVDVALDWHEANVTAARNSAEDGKAVARLSRIPVVNMANERRAGGDWESGLMAPEECFCRRSNLVHALTTVIGEAPNPHYPLAQRGGLYSPTVVVYRSGPDRYPVWAEFKPVPVISVAPVRRPKLDASGTRYSFEQEKELMLEKMRTVLRIAARHEHRDLCLGAFGAGVHFRNPISELAAMWRRVLFEEDEFKGVFANVVFAIEKAPAGGEKAGGPTEYEAFEKEFDPSNIFPSPYS
ncbi:MAG: hypothetical protein M1832_005939 [Thelocarpon impressellum]|nr:MAG: hypothetical protein M1832_005939 [Thelocarpon impressellum]